MSRSQTVKLLTSKTRTESCRRRIQPLISQTPYLVKSSMPNNLPTKQPNWQEQLQMSRSQIVKLPNSKTQADSCMGEEFSSYSAKPLPVKQLKSQTTYPPFHRTSNWQEQQQMSRSQTMKLPTSKTQTESCRGSIYRLISQTPYLSNSVNAKQPIHQTAKLVREAGNEQIANSEVANN